MNSLDEELKRLLVAAAGEPPPEITGEAFESALRRRRHTRQFSLWASAVVAVLAVSAAVTVLALGGSTNNRAPGEQILSQASGSMKIYLPTYQPAAGGITQNALFTGVLEYGLGCLWLRGRSGLQIPLIWPEGYYANGSPAEVFSPEGSLVASAGESISFGGGRAAVNPRDRCMLGISAAIRVQSRPIRH